jgi:hypothetical protein
VPQCRAPARSWPPPSHNRTPRGTRRVSGSRLAAAAGPDQVPLPRFFPPRRRGSRNPCQAGPRPLQALTPPRSRTECNEHDLKIHNVHALFTRSQTRGGPQHVAPPLSRSPPPLSVIILTSFSFSFPSRPLARCCSDQPDARCGRSCASFPGGTLGSPRVWNKIEQTNMHVRLAPRCLPVCNTPICAYQCPAIVGWSGERVG